jgi:heptaprenyl diphosphate synthase
MIPKPLPFFRIGLANLPLMLAIDLFPLQSFLVLVCIKVSGQALITGTLFSYIFLFSLTGTFLSALLMYFLRGALRKERITFIGIGTAGALVSNFSQLSLAYFFIFKENVFYIAPAFLAAGLVTGIALGAFCEVFADKSKWYKEIIEIKNKKEEIASPGIISSAVNFSEPVDKNSAVNYYNNIFSAKALFISGLLIIPAVLFNPVTEYRIAQFLFFWFLAILCGKKTNPVFTVLITAFIIIFNLLIPYGRVIFSIGAFKLTSGALEAGIHRAVTLQALVMLSKAAIRQDLKIPGAFGQLLGNSLQFFSVILGRKYRISAKNLIADIDTLMLELNEEHILPQTLQTIKTKPVGYVILVMAILISWLPWIIIPCFP